MSRSIAFVAGSELQQKFKWVKNSAAEQTGEGSDSQVLIEVEYGTISHGFEQSRYKQSEVNSEHLIGDGIIGRVVSVGKSVTSSLAPGDRVLARSHLSETVAVEADECIKIPESADWRRAILMPSLVGALQLTTSAGLCVQDVCVVKGLGAVGLMLVALAKHQGCVVVGVDNNRVRQVAASKAGADLVCGQDELDTQFSVRFGASTSVDFVFNCFASAAEAQTAAPGAGNILTLTYMQSAWGDPKQRLRGIQWLRSRHQSDFQMSASATPCAVPDRLFQKAFVLLMNPTGFAAGLEDYAIFPVVHFDGAGDLFQHLLFTSCASIKSAVTLKHSLPNQNCKTDLTPQQIAQFYRDGIVGPFQLEDTSILRSMNDCYQTKGYDFFWAYRNHHVHCAQIRRFCQAPEFLSKARSVLGDNIFVYLAQILPRKPDNEQQSSGDAIEYAANWHSDFENIKCRGVQIYMAMTDIKIDSGCLHYYPKTGREHTVASLRTQNIVTREPLLLKAGQYIMMDGFLIHRPTPNKSSHTRLVAIVRYSASGSECVNLQNKTREHLVDYNDPNPCMQVSGKDVYSVNVHYISSSCDQE